jgi:putative restriction endonuclease
MRKHWWVNHKMTHAQEIAGGYMWSPKRESDGKRSQYYENMRRARPGDTVVSYAGGAIRAMGTVLDAAIDAAKPEEFGSSGLSWQDQGWLVAVAWNPIKPIRPKDFLQSVAPLLPAKYSPLQAATGDGNQKAYLSEISEELFELLASRAGATGPTFSEVAQIKGTDFREVLEDAEEQKIQSDLTLSDTERAQLAMARRGQGTFRKNLLTVESCCRLTNISNSSLLVASHIKPWRSCLTAQERLDGHNGLLLAPQVDFLFDRGLIGFDQRGDLLMSSVLTSEDFQALGLVRPARHIFNSKQLAYLAYHQQNVFQD